MRSWLSLLASLTAVSLVALLAAAWQTGRDRLIRSQPSLSVSEMLGSDAPAGFAEPLQPRPFRFPEDHGEHPDFRTEWWYFTGNLGDFGYELTLFRQALLTPMQALIPRHSAWAARHAYLGHFTISDLRAGHFAQFEQISRAALDLAGCADRRVWLHDWTIRWNSAREFHIQAEESGYAIDLQLQSSKPPVLQGDEGLSRKGPEPGQASYYYSLTRLQTKGQLRTPARTTRVSGTSWMDREWSTRPLASNLRGWDWFALQLEDGCEIMVYQLRDRDGKPTEYSSGVVVGTQGESQPVSASDIHLKVTDSWTSPLDGTRYPAGWELDVAGYHLKIRPRLSNQELTGAARYWEGAVSVSGTATGVGYVELVGYNPQEKKTGR